MPEDTSSVGFRTSLFGFKKADVLACIEKMAAEAKQKEDEAQSRAQELQKTVDGLKENETILLEKTRDICDQLSDQNKRNAEIEKQAGELREQLRRSEDEAVLYKKRLFAKEQEALLLKGDKADLQQQLERQRQAAEQAQAAQQQAQRQMEQKVAAAEESARQEVFAVEENAEQRVEQARQQAQKEAVHQKAVMAAGAQDIADSVSVLKTQLAEVDAKIAAAASELQRTTAALHAALDGTEQNLELLGAQMRQFPQPAPGAKLPEPAPAQQEAQPEPPAQKVQPQTTAERRSLSALLLDKLARMLGE